MCCNVDSTTLDEANPDPIHARIGVANGLRFDGGIEVVERTLRSTPAGPTPAALWR